LWGILMANPIILVIAAIAALVAGFIYLWNTSEEFRQFWINLWEAIKSAAQAVVDALVNFFTKTVPEALSNLKAKAKETWDNLKSAAGTAWTNIKTTVVEKAKQMASDVGNKLKSLKDDAAKTWDNIRAVLLESEA
ncbi:MAG: hypothetical protein K6A94_06110, partial [Bacteroidales bacterium]|nr:hypothetical protein [Bacteroidales bacterium]